MVNAIRLSMKGIALACKLEYSGRCQWCGVKFRSAGERLGCTRVHTRLAKAWILKFRRPPRDLEAFDVRELGALDGWRCGVCRKPVDPSFPHRHPLSATIDHIVPLTQDGADEFWNLQLAHLRCNSMKGRRWGGIRPHRAA
jgi:5-methylcytosine-specific restriction endonuclease McrA